MPCPAEFGKPAGGIASRDSINDVCIEQLKKVEPLMYVLGACPHYATNAKNYYSRTYVDGLIGRMALEAGGYQTRRGDIKRVDGQGNPLTFETMGTANADMAAVQTGRTFTTLPRPTSKRQSPIPEQPYSTIPTHVRKTIRDAYSATLTSISSSRCTRLMLLMLTKVSSRFHTPRALMVV